MYMGKTKDLEIKEEPDYQTSLIPELKDLETPHPEEEKKKIQM